MRVVVLLASLVAAGCTPAHVEAESDFTPLAGNEFVFKSQAYAAMQADDERAEQMRREVLERRLAAGRFCPRGYEITERRAALHADGLLGKHHTIYYRGRCKG